MKDVPLPVWCGGHVHYITFNFSVVVPAIETPQHDFSMSQVKAVWELGGELQAPPCLMLGYLIQGLPCEDVACIVRSFRHMAYTTYTPILEEAAWQQAVTSALQALQLVRTPGDLSNVLILTDKARETFRTTANRLWGEDARCNRRS